MAATIAAAPAASAPVAPKVDPLLERARLKVTKYRGSQYFREDNPWLKTRILIGLALVAACGSFSIPWMLAKEAPKFESALDVLHFVVAWGAVPIFLLSFRAIAHARYALADLGVNIAIARHAERSATARLQEIRRDPRTRGHVSLLESEHLPDNPDNPKPASLRLFQRICAEAMDRRFESTINLMEPYQRESMEPVLQLEGVQKSALRWGILCHFIGLVLVINAVPGMLNSGQVRPAEPSPQAVGSQGSAAERVSAPPTGDTAIPKILEGLRLAFGASVGGLSVSLFAAMLLSTVRKKQFAYFRKLDEATATMISLATNSLNNDELMVSLQQVSERLQEQTVTVKEGILTLASAIATQAKTIDAGLRSLGDGKTRLDGFLKGVSDSHEEFLKRLNTYYDVGTITSAVNSISKEVDKMQKRTVTILKTDIQGLQQVVSGVEQSTSLHLGSGMFRLLPHTLLALAGFSAAILALLLWRLS